MTRLQSQGSVPYRKGSNSWTQKYEQTRRNLTLCLIYLYLMFYSPFYILPIIYFNVYFLTLFLLEFLAKNPFFEHFGDFQKHINIDMKSFTCKKYCLWWGALFCKNAQTTLTLLTYSNTRLLLNKRPLVIYANWTSAISFQSTPDKWPAESLLWYSLLYLE